MDGKRFLFKGFGLMTGEVALADLSLEPAQELDEMPPKSLRRYPHLYPDGKGSFG